MTFPEHPFPEVAAAGVDPQISCIAAAKCVPRGSTDVSDHVRLNSGRGPPGLLPWVSGLTEPDWAQQSDRSCGYSGNVGA